MNRDDAEAYTEALGRIVEGGWRQAALGERLGVPQALGLTTREWVQDRLGGYLKLTASERREAVTELTEDGMTTRQIEGVLGVDHATAARDRRVVANATEPEPRPLDIDDLSPDTETVCPTCHGTGRILISEGSLP